MSVIFISLKSNLLRLNLFNTGSESEQIIRNERRSTRLYLLLLTISMAILLFYYSIIPFTETNTIESPSFTEYSKLAQQRALQCLCAKIAIKHDEFVQIQPFYHELCQSDFMSADWIDHLFLLYQQSWNNSISSDFRRIAVFQFQTLRSFCQLAQETIANGLRSFQRTDFIQSQLVEKGLFQLQINSFITKFIDSLSKLFVRTLHLIQNTTAQSLLMTGASLTSVLPSSGVRFFFHGLTIPYPGSAYIFSDNSSCTCSSSTAVSCMGVATLQNSTVPGFQTGCYMVNALLKSSLDILYNQSFVDMLSNSSKYFYKLNGSMPNQTVELLLGQLFVNYWWNTTSYRQYFDACAPDVCYYTVNERYGIVRIVTLIIGLFGGLTTALRIIAPIIICKTWPAVHQFMTKTKVSSVQSDRLASNTESFIHHKKETFFQSVRRNIVELNWYKSIPPSKDIAIIRQQRHSTYIYLIILFASLSILTLFTTIRVKIVSVTIQKPTLTQFFALYNRYPLTLNCPCSQGSLSYDQLILHMKPEYHQVCSSEFISPKWINVEFIKPPNIYIYTHDIRSQSQIHFQLLSTLCHVSRRTVADNLQSFYDSKFVSPQVLTEESFELQTSLIVEQFKSTVPETFQHTLELLQANLELNQFIVPSNSYFSIDDGSDGSVLWLRANFYSDRPDCLRNFTSACICYILSNKVCYKLTRILDEGPNQIIPGMFFTWFPLQSLMISTLECFYSETCLSSIVALINGTVSPTNFSTLQLSSKSDLESSFEPIAVLAARLFIQSWKNASSYQSYFNACHPLTCHYTYQNRLAPIYIITTLIGYLGGLLVAAHLLSPLIVKLSHAVWSYGTRRQPNSAVAVQTVSVTSAFANRFRLCLQFLTRTVVELNLFQPIPPSQDPRIIRRNQYTTRVYVISVIVAMFLVLMYTSLTTDTLVVTVNSPSVSKYMQLSAQYPSTLYCPCTQIAIKYDKFILQLEPQYHQICSSAFISFQWIDSLQGENQFVENFRYGDDFRAVIRLQFLILSRLCDLSHRILNSSLFVFRQTKFVTACAISHAEFIAQMEAAIAEFKTRIIDQFMQTFKLIQSTNHGNQLATTFSSNWKFILKYSIDSPFYWDNLIDLPALTLTKTYGNDNCSCAIQPNCSKPTDFAFRTSSQSLRQVLPGFRVGCFPLDALLQSSLVCLYNQSCLDMMRALIYYSTLPPVEILGLSSDINPETSIEAVLTDLFVPHWLQDVSFDRYFEECSPQLCQYSYSNKFNRIYIVTTFIAVFSGLTKGLHIIVSCAAFLLFKLYDHLKKKEYKNAIAPHSQCLDAVVLDKQNDIVDATSRSTITITTQLSVNPTNCQRTHFRITKADRIYLVFLTLLVMVVVLTVFIVWSKSIGNEDTSDIISTSSTSFVTSSTITESISEVTNTCHMTFRHQVQTDIIGLQAKSFIIIDLNRDMILDLAVANFGDDTISILLGSENGIFQTPLLYSTGNGTRPWGITAGYFNNDLLLDIAVTLTGVSKVAIFYGVDTDALFTSTLTILTPSDDNNNTMSAIQIADLNTDGLADLVVSNHINTNFGGYGSVLIFFNLGFEPYFENSISASVADYNSMDISDFDSDGVHNDIAFCRDDGIVQVFVSIDYITGAWSWPPFYYTNGLTHSLIHGKFNNDEFDDLAVISPETSTLQILFANGYGTFTQQTYPTDRKPVSVARINFNSDQIDDIVILSCSQTANVFVGTSRSIFDRNYIPFDTHVENSGQCALSLKVADLNRDGSDDLVIVNAETRSIHVLMGMSCDD